jgi:hypothetical protein
MTRSGYDVIACGRRRLGDIPPQPVSAARDQQTFAMANISSG